MATQTIIFAARRTPTAVHVRNLVGGTETAGSTITALDDGLYSAEFSALSGDFTLHLLDGSAVMGVGSVWDVTNTAATFYEQDLVQPSSGGGGGCPSESEIAAEVIAQLAAANLNPQNVISPYPQGGTIRTLQGAAYKASLGNRKLWPDVNGAWPVLSTATIVVKIDQGDDAPLEFEGEVVTATGSDKVVGLELSMADTTSIAATEASTAWRYWVIATIGSDEFELASGKWISSEQPEGA